MPNVTGDLVAVKRQTIPDEKNKKVKVCQIQQNALLLAQLWH